MGPAANSIKAFTIWGTLGFLIVLPLLFIDWNKKSEYPQLERGVQVVRYLSAPRQLGRSSFPAAYPRGRPSDFVKWMFSTMGTAEWPPAEDGVDQATLEAAKSLRFPVIPAGLRIVPEKPEPTDKRRQLVVKGDDARGMLVVDAYTHPAGPPVFTREWPLKLPRSPHSP